MNRFEFYDNVRKFKENQEENSLAHYGTKGQKWGERHWQNADGTFNEAGKERYFGSSGKKDLSKEKVGGKYRTVMNSKGYYHTKYQNDDGSLTRKGQKLYDKAQRKEGYHLSGIIDEDFLREYNNKQNLAVNNSINKLKEIDNAIKVTKKLKSKDITDEEFNTIAKDVISSDYSKLSEKDYNDIADLGLYKMDKAGILMNDDKPGNRASREWFMEEDQTIGYPELVDLYRKGYSKDYVDKFLQKMYKIEMEEENGIEKAENISWALSESAHWLTEGDRSFLNALYDDKEVSGLFKSKEEKELKKLEKEATRINENMNNSSWDKRDEIIKEVLKDPKYKDTFDEIDAEFDKESEKSMHRTEEIFNDFKENETLNLATAGITNMFNTGYYPNPTMEDLGRTSWSYIYDDGNQGDNTAEYLYATIDKQVSSKELNELYKQLHSKTDFLNDNAAKLKEDVRFKNIDERNLKKIIDKKLDNKYQDNKAYWNLYAANEGWRQEPDDKLKKNYSEAKNITKKLQPSCGNSNGWDYLNKAIENLDLSATELKNMTQSDWDRVNAEVNRLKK